MRRHTILFGVQDYPGHGGLTALACPHADVDRLERIAANERFMGPDPRVIAVKSPTLDTAKKELSQFFRGVERGDIVIFYFSGHGMRNDDGDLFLCFTDTDENDLELTALNISQLSDVMRAKRLNRVLVVLDCCYSGAAGAQLTRDSVKNPINRAENALPDGKGIYVLSASGATQTAKEGEGSGVFTRHLAAGIESGEADDDNDGHVTVHDLALYLQRKVPEDAPNQVPYLSSKATTGTFVVAENQTVLEHARQKEASERREPVFLAVRDRLIDALKSGFVSHTDLNQVMDWMDANPACDVGSACFALLEKFGSGSLTWPQFKSAWDEQQQDGKKPETRERTEPVGDDRRPPKRKERVERREPEKGDKTDADEPGTRRRETGAQFSSASQPGFAYRFGRGIAKVRNWLIGLLVIGGYALLGVLLLDHRVHESDLTLATIVSAGALGCAGLLAGTLGWRGGLVFLLIAGGGFFVLQLCHETGYSYIKDRPYYIASRGERQEAVFIAALAAPVTLGLALVFRWFRRARRG